MDAGYWWRYHSGVMSRCLCAYLSCIHCGLIQTNTGYEQLFEVCTMGAQITDQDYHVIYTSANAMKLSEMVMREAEKEEVRIDKKTMIKNRPIQGGHILWQEDNIEEDIMMLLDRLEENRKTIEESNCLEQENYQTKAKIYMLREKNRLYDKLQTQTAGQIGLLNGADSMIRGKKIWQRAAGCWLRSV